MCPGVARRFDRENHVSWCRLLVTTCCHADRLLRQGSRFNLSLGSDMTMRKGHRSVRLYWHRTRCARDLWRLMWITSLLRFMHRDQNRAQRPCLTLRCLAQLRWWNKLTAKDVILSI